jgi:DNA-binding SARP family transcriptional activator
MLSDKKARTISPGSAADDYLHPADLLRLCVKSLATDTETETVHRLIRHFDLQPDSTAYMLEYWPWPVRIYTLGRFSVEIDGRPLHFSGKAQKRPLDLLKALIAFGGHEVSQEKLAETIWPDSTGDDAQHNLMITLHRLRKLIGREVVTRSQGTLSVSTGHCWTDLRSLEYHMTRAACELEREHISEAWVLTLKAMRLYRGAFLASDSTVYWVLSVSERVRRRMLHHIDVVCAALRRNAHYEQAIEGYLVGLDIDDLQERFYQGLIFCHNQLGQEAEALSVYDRCRTMMLTVLGRPPSARTRSLIQ